MDELVAIDPTEPIGTVMRVALLTGFTVTFPYIFYQVWLFVAPAMIELRNRIRSLITIPIATAFFYAGMAFAYFVMLPTALPFMLNFMGIKTVPRPSSYITFTTGMLFWIGIAFEFPIVIYFMATMGLVKAELLLSQWKLAIVIIAVIAAVITPTVDPVNMALVMGPLIVLYFLSILLAKFAQIGRSRRLAAKT
jgi:sec-independent protein translocase protein TatC